MERINPPIKIGMTMGMGNKQQTRPHVIEMQVYAVWYEKDVTHPYWGWAAIGDNGCIYIADSAGRVANDQLHTLNWEMRLGERTPQDIFLLGD